MAHFFNLTVLSLLALMAATALGLWANLSALGFAVTAEWELAQIGSVSFEFPVLLDLYSCAFILTVSLITCAILVFSKSYMAHEKHFLRFHLLVLAFVLSMFLLILSPNLVSLLLGWDGLGVTSYLLVIYFQSAKSFNAGLLTALTNRVGDVLILFAIALSLLVGSWSFHVWAHAAEDLFLGQLMMAMMIVAATTKSAQVPFSAWLPAAMAAPTPVSSLVHSSTLVTAGVYLLFRFGETLATNALLIYVLSVGVLTMLMAGVSALHEMDMKKIVALSTLSQLGLMMTTLGLGLYDVAFFHLLTHAFFKALLFMSVGNMIHLSSDFQDLRKIGLTEFSYPVTLSFSVVANCSLCGLPFMAGFYSKDLILELSMLADSGTFMLLLFYSAVMLTAAYTVRFSAIVMWGSLKMAPSFSAHDNDSLMNYSMSALWPLAIAGGAALSWFLFLTPSFVSLPLEVKNLTASLILLAVFGGLFWHLRKEKTDSGLSVWTWGLMWSLPLISSSGPSGTHLLASSLLRKLDLSWVPHFTWSSALSLDDLSLADGMSLTKNFTTIVAPLLWALVVLVFFYLCILNLINSWGLKTHRASHLYMMLKGKPLSWKQTLQELPTTVLSPA